MPPRLGLAKIGGAAVEVARTLLPVAAWMLVAGLAIAAFLGREASGPGGVVRGDALGFAYAFSIAGTIAGAVALATFGRKRRAVGFGAIGLALIGASVPALRSLIFRITAPSLSWGRYEWDVASGCIGPGLAVGVLAAAVIGALIPAFGVVKRRMAPWKFGLTVAVAVAALGLWGLPMAVAGLADRSIPYLRWHHGFGYDEAFTGAAAGAGPGALGGAIVAGLAACWLGSSRGHAD